MRFGRRVAVLESTAGRGVVFGYDSEYLASELPAPLSISLPLRDGEYSQAQARPFFSGLLPDDDLRRRIADDLHVSEAGVLGAPTRIRVARALTPI